MTREMHYSPDWPWNVLVECHRSHYIPLEMPRSEVDFKSVVILASAVVLVLIVAVVSLVQREREREEGGIGKECTNVTCTPLSL